MLVLGCDCSSKQIALVLLGNDYFWCENLIAKESDSDVRSRTLFREFGVVLDDLEFNSLRPNMVYVEQAVYLQNIKTTLSIDSVINAVKFNCVLRSIPYTVIDNKLWKKDILGNGKATKENIFEFASVKWEGKIDNQDIADAACIALYGFKKLGG